MWLYNYRRQRHRPSCCARCGQTGLVYRSADADSIPGSRRWRSVWRSIAELDDPVGCVMTEWRRPNKLKIERVRTPLGVIGVIYESRPNVTADAGALCLKAGNASILRGGSESYHSARAIHSCLREGLHAAGLPETAIQLVPTTDRDAVGEMLRGLDGAIDVIVPRGGKSLVGRVQDGSTRAGVCASGRHLSRVSGSRCRSRGCDT